MASGGQPLRLGPFIGGLNTASDPTAIADAELAQCSNFELDIDGSLVSRCPMIELDGHINWTERIICICEATFSGTSYLIGSNTNGVFYKTSGGGAWTLITNTFRSTAAVQYANFVYLVAIPGSANPGGKWSPSGGFTAVSAIPKGMACVIHKERLFVVPGVLATSNESRLSFSNAGNFDTWGGTDFIDVKQGDGTNLIDLTVFQDNLILFKNKSSHVLAYDTRPTDAVLREISKTIGVDRQFCLANYENQIYIFHGGWVYEIINYDFHRLNVKVPFAVDDTAPGTFTSENVFISLLADRLICRFHRNIYVYGLRTRTWSQWNSSKDRLHYFGPIVTVHASSGNEYYAGSCISSFFTTVQLFNTQNTTNVETTIDPSVDITDTFTRSVSNGWGTATTGQVWTTNGGSAGDYSVTGTQGKYAMNSVNVVRATLISGLSKLNWNVTNTVSVSAVATGASIQHITTLRLVDGNNYYNFTLDFATSGTLSLAISKNVGGSGASLNVTAFGSYSANELFSYRIVINGSNIKTKIWRAANPEPGAWFQNVTDTGVTSPGGMQLASYLNPGNTNTLPINVLQDNFNIGDPANNTALITCSILTKNYDMAVSHRFKRLWWWGADISSNNIIKGTATPIVLTFVASWGNLASKQWNQLLTWGRPLSVISSEISYVSSGTGTSRKFVHFLKSLRYRQINFGLELTTYGSTADGPCRIFSLTVITETKAVA